MFSLVAVSPVLAAGSASPTPVPMSASTSTATPAPLADRHRIEPLPLPTACALDIGLSLEEALGRPISDEADRDFVSAVRHRSARDLVTASRHAIPPELVRRVNEASNETCTGASASVVATRAFVVATATHTVDLDDGGQNSLLIALGYAAAALAARSKLSESDVDAAMAPFGMTVESLTSNAPVAGCAGGRVLAKVTDKVDPVFPAQAISTRDFGSVRIAVHLDTDGIASYVRPYEETRDASNSLVQAALVAAGSSLYDVGTIACRPQPSNYLFVSEFQPGAQGRIL